MRSIKGVFLSLRHLIASHKAQLGLSRGVSRDPLPDICCPETPSLAADPSLNLKGGIRDVALHSE